MSEDVESEKLNILLVDDQESKLLSYEVILAPLGERLLFARSGAEALQVLLRTEVAVVLIDVSMPGLDGFELASMIRDHPRFEQLAIIFVSAIHLSVADILRGYEKGALDYVPVPIVPELLRAKVATFLDLHRKTRQLERLNQDLEARVAQRTEALEAASRRQELLAREVDHRARNALAVVQAIVNLTKADDIDAFSAAVRGRIRALAHAHALLSSSRWKGADLAGIALEELAPYDHDDRISIGGPPVRLNPASAQMIALALHELATNAAKYGALSNDAGRVSLSWVEEQNGMRLTWSESGGPPVLPPARRGFGTTVIEQSMAAQLSGEVSIEWRPEGLLCSAFLPKQALMHPDAQIERAPAAARGRQGAAESVGVHARILLVEDEALVALELAGLLKSLGHEVLGPAHSLAEGVALAQSPVDLAILDVNLGGEEVFPLADALSAKLVPIVFLTGYDRDAVPQAFGASAVLQKPFEIGALRAAIEETLKPSLVSCAT